MMKYTEKTIKNVKKKMIENGIITIQNTNMQEIENIFKNIEIKIFKSVIRNGVKKIKNM